MDIKFNRQCSANHFIYREIPRLHPGTHSFLPGTINIFSVKQCVCNYVTFSRPGNEDAQMSRNDSLKQNRLYTIGSKLKCVVHCIASVLLQGFPIALLVVVLFSTTIFMCIA